MSPPSIKKSRDRAELRIVAPLKRQGGAVQSGRSRYLPALDSEGIESMQLSGVFVAAATPTDTSGSVDFKAFEDLLEFLLSYGVDGICVGGATSEYPCYDLGQRKDMISAAARKVSGRAILLAAVGASTFQESLELGRHAVDAGAPALLLPPPYFYRYEQADLEAFYRHACRLFPAPLLLYNLPEFTNPLEIDTSIRLLREEPRLIGIKDSSGDVQALARLKQAQSGPSCCLLCGNDKLFYLSLYEGWDGGISGLGNLCPGLLVRSYRSFRDGERRVSEHCQKQLDALIAQVNTIPFPWAIRAGLEVLGFSGATLPLPLSDERKTQLAAFREWCADWLSLQDTTPSKESNS